MSINQLRILSVNHQFFSLLVQSFLTGYGKPCKVKIIFLAMSLIYSSKIREKLSSANVKSRLETILNLSYELDDLKISGKFNSTIQFNNIKIFKPYCKDALIILYSEKKIIIKDFEVILLKSINYTNFNKTIKLWLRCAYYLGIIFSKTLEEYLNYFLGVEIE